MPDLLDDDDDDEDEFEYPPKSRRKARRGYRVDTLTTDDYRWRVGILTINERELPQQITKRYIIQQMSKKFWVIVRAPTGVNCLLLSLPDYIDDDDPYSDLPDLLDDDDEDEFDDEWDSSSVATAYHLFH